MTRPKPASPSRRHLASRLAAAAILVAGVLAYSNSLRGPFVFDDSPAIVENASIRHLSNLREVLFPQLSGGETVSGRPVVNLTLALNYAIGGERVWVYHATNLVIHLLAGLVLFGLVRRTLDGFYREAAADAPSVPVAAAVAGLWTLHPLQTESVTYIVQRAEALAGLFCLLTLYAFSRSTRSASPGRWLGASWLTCLLGMATKEVMVATPLLVLLYDRTFVAGTFQTAWTRRRRYYLALAATWVLLIALVGGTRNRGGTAGFDVGVTPWHYLLTQTGAIVRYLRLALWPDALVFDYGTSIVASITEVILPAIVVVGLLIFTIRSMRRRPVTAFLGWWFFALLAPSSSVVPIASQTVAEHRVYLALAAPITAAVLLAWGRFGHRALLVAAVVAGAWAVRTHARNEDYRSETILWSDTLAKAPNNARAHHNVGLEALRQGRTAEAIADFQRALRLRPDSAEPHYDLGLCYAKLGRFDDAIREYETTLALQPAHAEAHNNLGTAQLALGHVEAARTQFEAAVRLKPAFAAAHNNLSLVWLQSGSPEKALRAAEAALQLKPDYAEAFFSAGNACAELRRFAEARSHYESAVRLRPDYAEARSNLANVLLELDRPADAIAQLEEAIRLQPAYFAPRRTLALVLLGSGRATEALPHLELLALAQPADSEIGAALRQARQAARR